MIDQDGTIVSGKRICSNKSRTEMLQEDFERKLIRSLSDIHSALNRIADNLVTLTDATRRQI